MRIKGILCMAMEDTILMSNEVYYMVSLPTFMDMLLFTLLSIHCTFCQAQSHLKAFIYPASSYWDILFTLPYGIL